MATKDIASRIKYLMQELGYRQRDFAERIGVDASNLSKYLNGRLPVSESLVNKLVVGLGVSKRWLVSGDDLPFAKQQPLIKDVSVGDSAIELRGSTVRGQGTPVYDVDVTAGNMPRDILFADDLITGYINLPDVVSDQCRVVRVSGDSMSPVIRNGDYIAVRELTNMQQIYWGQIYVVLLDDYRLVKYIRRHPDPAMLILRSENKRYDDMEVKRTEVRDLMFVQTVLHFDPRM